MEALLKMCAKLKKGKGGKIPRHKSLLTVAHLIHRVCLSYSVVFQFQEDFCVSKPVKRVLRKYDKLLKSFQSSKALDAVLEVSHCFLSCESCVLSSDVDFFYMSN